MKAKLAPVKSGIAHLYFESIHPFEDGNGRIGRAISEKILYQEVGHPIPLSISRAIESNKAAYYGALKQAQRTNNLTKWLTYFVQTILDAQDLVETQIHFTIQKTKFFDRHSPQLNQRQHKVIRRMLDEGPNSFKGRMTAKKYMSIAKCSKATATRDLQELVKLRIFQPEGVGRSTRYALTLE